MVILFSIIKKKCMQKNCMYCKMSVHNFYFFHSFSPIIFLFFLLFLLLLWFFFNFTARVPRLKSSGYQFLGLILSEKSWVYLLTSQLLLSGGIRSMVPALSGYFVGYLYDLDYCSMQTYRFPRFIEVRTLLCRVVLRCLVLSYVALFCLVLCYVFLYCIV